MLNEWKGQMSMHPGIAQSDSMGQDKISTGFDIDTIPVTDKGCVGDIELMPGAAKTGVMDVVSLPADPPQPVTGAPTRLLSVETIPTSIGSIPTKRGGSESFLEKFRCQSCDKDYKTKSHLL
jgi:hypothetical protein